MQKHHFYRRHLPHIYVPEGTYFITFRLKGTLPQTILNDLRNQLEKSFKLPKEERYNEQKNFLSDMMIF